MICNDCKMAEHFIKKGRAEAIKEFQEWLQTKVDIVGFDDKTNKILVGKDGKWVSAIDEWLKEKQNE